MVIISESIEKIKTEAKLSELVIIEGLDRLKCILAHQFSISACKCATLPNKMTIIDYC